MKVSILEDFLLYVVGLIEERNELRRDVEWLREQIRATEPRTTEPPCGRCGQPWKREQPPG